MRQEVRTLSSQYADGSLMYPGKWLFTWVSLGLGVWHLVRIEPYEARP